jgi:hypothetical protein
MDNQIDAKINNASIRDDGKIKCTNCKCWRTPPEFIGKSGKTVKTCQKCRDNDDKKKMTDASKEKRRIRDNENKYYIKYRDKKRAENEEEYLAHNAKLAKEYRQRRKQALHQKQEETSTQDPNKSSCLRCGKEFIIFQTAHKVPSTKCPECYQKQQDVESRRARLRYSELIKRAKEKGLPLTLSEEQHADLSIKPCIYCEFMPQVGYNGIDRMDNQEGYTPENSVPCCTECNRSKHVMHPQYYIEKAQAITAYQQDGNLSLIDQLSRLWIDYKKKTRPAVYQQYKNMSEKRGIEFSLSENEYNTLLSGRCYLCGVEENYMGIDRKDNSKGYIPGNSFTCCSICNLMKAYFDYDEFISRMARIQPPEDITLWNTMTSIKDRQFQWTHAT